MPRANANKYRQMLTGTTVEETEYQTEYRADERNNSWVEANPKLAEFYEELRSLNHRAAESLEGRKNPAEYRLEEKQELVEAVSQAFNQVEWSSRRERFQAAGDIADHLYSPLYRRVEYAEAMAAYEVPEEFIQDLKQEQIEYLDLKLDEAGRERLEVQVKDLETARKMVEDSGGAFHIVSTRNLDRYRDQFADALYASDRDPEAQSRMETSLEAAVSYYQGDITKVERWDEHVPETNSLWTGEEPEGDRKQTEAGAEEQREDWEVEAFRKLQKMDEYEREAEIERFLEEKLSHTAEYVHERTVAGQGDAMALTGIHQAMHAMVAETIRENARKPEQEEGVSFLAHVEAEDLGLQAMLEERDGLIDPAGYRQPTPPADWTDPNRVNDYLAELRSEPGLQETELDGLHHALIERLADRIQEQTEELQGLDPREYEEEFLQMQQDGAALEYLTRAADPVFWRLREAGLEQQEAVLDENMERQLEQGINDGLRTPGGAAPSAEWLERDRQVDDAERQELLDLTLGGIAMERKAAMQEALNAGDHNGYRDSLEQAHGDARFYTERINGILHGELTGEEESEYRIPVEHVPEPPERWEELQAGHEPDAALRLKLEQSGEFRRQYDLALNGYAGDRSPEAERTVAMAADLGQTHEAYVNELKEGREDAADLDRLEYLMTKLLREGEKEPNSPY